ncbi:SRPBCC family protein [Actinoallomurus purpureus]|uniref:SRPBCC family protein n=1 Tax=Actinoallomurus purpureus TaxID=478114 RepID=UPI002092239A|nr:SRPBCC family protein [Actinoallomurus purpureus]MCO6004659.1 SRPBCC family protein [Actinoallomurus purpureus]
MELDHEFTVPVPVDQAWRVLLDVERIAPCMPGATLDAADADEFTGRLKVRLGAMTITYRGTARIASRDESDRTVTIEASGKEARGPGTASATVQAQLFDEDGRTRVTVHTKLNVTGRPAQFGRGILGEVGGKLIGRFADNLAAELAEGAEKTAGAEAPTGAEPLVTEGTEAPAEARAATDAAGAATAEEAVADRDETGGTPGTGEDTTGVPAQNGRGTGFPSGQAAAKEESDAERGVSAAPAEPARATATGAPSRRPEAEPIDLLQVAGPSVLKRAAPLIVGLALLLTLWRLIRRRR